MRNALILNGTIICVVSVPIFLLKGKQTRRERDEIEARRTVDPTVAGLSSRMVVEESKGSKDT